LQNQGSVLATRPAGLLVFNCSTNMSCSFSGTTFTITSSATAGAAWSSLTNPTANLSMSHAAFTTTFTWGAATGLGVNLFTFTDTLNNTGTGILHRVFTASGSAATPFQADANGVGWKIATSGNLLPVSTASLAVPGTAHGVMLSEGGSTAIATTATGTSGQVLISNGAGADPAFADPQVTGNVASGAADSGNPVKIGYVFNTTQPTVTTGQRVDAQSTARGAAIVATGVDTFNVTVNTALPAGSNVIGALSANQSVNVAQFGGTSVVTGTGASGAGIPRVTVANDSAVKMWDGTNVMGVDPCMNSANTRASVNINQAAGAQLITGVAGKQTYICSFNVVTATAQNLALVEGTGVACATGTAGMAGGATAATGWNFAANGGMALASAGFWIFKTASAADNVCLLQSGTGQVSGNLTYVQQ